MKVAIYARVSTLDKGQDIGLQVDELRRAAVQRGWTITGEYLDEGVSGAKDNRPALNRLRQDARKGRFETLVVWKLDRLGRSTLHLLTLLEELTQAGISYVSLREQIDTSSPLGRMVLQLQAVFAQFEREVIRERVQAGVDRARERGVRLGRPRKEANLEAAVALLEAGKELREVARLLKVNRNTLRDRLREARKWPLQNIKKPE